MENNSFTIKIENSPFLLIGGHLKNFSSFSKLVYFDKADNNDLVFHFREDTNKNQFNDILEAIIKERSFFSYLLLILKNKFGSFLTIFVSVLIIVFIALLSIHGAMSYEIFSGGESENIFNFQGIYVYGLISLLILGMLIFSPKIILGEFNNLLEWVDSVLSNNKQMTRRNENLVNLIIKKRKIESIVIVNPFIQGRDSWIIEQVLPSLKKVNIPVKIFIKHDERQNILELFKKNNLFQISLLTDGGYNFRSNGEVYSIKLLSSIEKEYLSLLLFCSTLNLPKSWKNNKDNYVSIELLETLNQLFGEKYLSQNMNLTVNKFIKRCLFDYGYVSMNSGYKESKFVINPRLINQQFLKTDFSSLKDEISSNLNSIKNKLNDPYGILILLGIVSSGTEINPKRIELLEKFINRTYATENYGLFSEYWDNISVVNKSNSDMSELNILSYLNSETLLNLSQCFSNSGLYHDALSTYRILEIIYPVKAAIGIADTKENLGEYNDTLEILYKTEKKWIKSGIIENQDTLLELFLNIAWVIVGARFEKKKKNGYKYLQKSRDILDRLPNKSNYILFLSRYFNTLANYKEWDNNYEEAINCYEKALRLPGQFLRKSVLLGNRGTAKRLIGRSLIENPVEQEKYFLSSMMDAKQSLEMKIEIGEKNQIPISCHNLSETLIELAELANDLNKKREFLKKANDYALQGFEYLKKNNSTKKMGRLLVEIYISSILLSRIGDRIDSEKPLELLTTWFGSENVDSYDYCEVQKVLERFNIKL